MFEFRSLGRQTHLRGAHSLASPHMVFHRCYWRCGDKVRALCSWKESLSEWSCHGACGPPLGGGLPPSPGCPGAVRRPLCLHWAEPPGPFSSLSWSLEPPEEESRPSSSQSKINFLFPASARQSRDWLPRHEQGTHSTMCFSKSELHSAKYENLMCANIWIIN